MICCMTCPWVSSLGPPVSSPVSSPSRPRWTLSPSAASVAIRRFSSRPQPSLQHGKRRLYTNLRPHALSDRRSPPPVATVSSPVVPAPPGSVATVPPDSVATFSPNSVATAAASPPNISSMLSKSAISVANACKNKMADAAGCMAVSIQMYTKDRSRSKNHRT